MQDVFEINSDFPAKFSSQGNAPPAAGQAVPITDVQVALDGAAGPWRQFLRLTNRMESRLVKLENNESEFPPESHGYISWPSVFSQLPTTTVPVVAVPSTH